MIHTQLNQLLTISVKSLGSDIVDKTYCFDPVEVSCFFISDTSVIYLVFVQLWSNALTTHVDEPFSYVY